MMTYRYPLLGLLSCFVGLLTSFAQTAAQKDDANRVVEDATKIKQEEISNQHLPTLWIIGDSTVRVNTKGQRGWGDEMAPFFDLSKINLVNRAIGGRSSRTFITDGRWDLIMSEMQPGDVVIMQFGHNDGGKINDDSRARGTIRGTGEEIEEIDNILTKKHEVVHSYGWYMRKYVNDTVAKGGIPIVCSLIPRKQWDAHGKIIRSTESYGKWAREVAEQTKARFIDLNELIALKYEELGAEAVDPLFADPHTHTSVEGAKLNASCVVAGLKLLKDNPLEKFLK